MQRPTRPCRSEFIRDWVFGRKPHAAEAARNTLFHNDRVEAKLAQHHKGPCVLLIRPRDIDIHLLVTFQQAVEFALADPEFTRRSPAVTPAGL